MPKLKDIVKYLSESVLRKILGFISIAVPVKRNRIILYSYSGEQYSCSPKSISEYLIKNYPDKYEIIWAFRDLKTAPRLRYVKTVKYQSLKFMYYYASSHFIINNIYPYHLLKTKKNQIMIDTWHGGGAYKVAGFDTRNDPILARTMEYNKNNISVFVSSSEMFTKYFINGGMNYYGKVINTGLQRNDIFFFRDSVKQKLCMKVRKSLGIAPDEKICLYAPTWRGKDECPFRFDEKALTQALEERFGGKWRIIVRMHRLTEKTIEGNIIDAGSYPDMQKLLLSADCLITDYSSSIWDYSLTGKPCFLYVYDLDNYLDERSMYINIKKWGFPLCRSFDDILNEIRNFSEEEYAGIVKYHHSLLGNYENGTACRQLARYIIDNT